MLTLNTACQVKPIRVSVHCDPANEKERLSVLKEMHAHSQYGTAWQVKPIRIGVSYDSAKEKERLSVLKEMHAHSHSRMSPEGYLS